MMVEPQIDQVLKSQSIFLQWKKIGRNLDLFYLNCITFSSLF